MAGTSPAMTVNDAKRTGFRVSKRSDAAISIAVRNAMEIAALRSQ